MRKCKMCGAEVGARRQFCDKCKILRVEEYRRRQNERRRIAESHNSVYKYSIPRKTIQPKVTIAQNVAEANERGLSYGQHNAPKVEVKLPAWIGG